MPPRLPTLRFALEDSVSQFSRVHGRPPSILDWTGWDVAAAWPELSVARAARGEHAPDVQIADLIAVDSIDALADALSLLPAGVVVLKRADRGFTSGTEWRIAPAPQVATFSLVVTAFNSSAITLRCLDSIRRTLPAWFRGEVIVIDDASQPEEWAQLSEYCASSGFKTLRNERNEGYIRSCNRAAATATGDILVLLNNDTELVPGWLDAFRSAFERIPDAGAIGGKMLYPSGRLQEAGVVCFSDATGWNVGRGDDPAAPLYDTTREVDYCSAAFLATPREVWNRVGGYDETLVRGYYEDAWYCFAVRQLGLRVIYEPAARIVHIEGATSGTDITSGQKQFQVSNRTRFFERWKDQLESHESPPLYLDDAAMLRAMFDPAKPRILMLGSNLPEYDREGGSKAMYDCAMAVRAEGWNVVWASPRATAEERYARVLRQAGIFVFPAIERDLPGEPFPRNLERLVVTADFDVVLIHFWHLAHEWAPAIRRISPRTRIVIHSHDLNFLRESRRLLREASGDAESLLHETWALEARLELNAYARADRVIAVSAKEARLIEDFTGKPGHAAVVPVMEDVKRSRAPFAQRRGIVFLASFRHPPNIEAATYLFREILPRLGPQLLEEHPLTVIGTGLDDRIRELAGGTANIDLIGWVPSIYPWLERARVSVIPLLHGAGVKNKLVQSSMVGTPAVCTSVAVEGLELQPGRDVLVADDADSFAESLRFILSDERMWNDLAGRARAVVEGAHSPGIFRERLMAALQF